MAAPLKISPSLDHAEGGHLSEENDMDWSTSLHASFSGSESVSPQSSTASSPKICESVASQADNEEMIFDDESTSIDPAGIGSLPVQDTHAVSFFSFKNALRVMLIIAAIAVDWSSYRARMRQSPSPPPAPTLALPHEYPVGREAYPHSPPTFDLLDQVLKMTHRSGNPVAGVLLAVSEAVYRIADKICSYGKYLVAAASRGVVPTITPFESAETFLKSVGIPPDSCRTFLSILPQSSDTQKVLMLLLVFVGLVTLFLLSVE